MANTVDLKNARVLISNDDGINAPGIEVLERIAHEVAREVWVVAPETEQSATSHSLTCRRPLRIRQVSERRFAVDGSPTDSVLVGMREVLQQNPPDIVLSGVNRGANICDDVTYSGTVAAAMEGTLLGVPSIALSLATEGSRDVRWETVEHWAPDILRRLTGIGWPENVLINVNFPNIPTDAVTGISMTSQGIGKAGQGMTKDVDPHGDVIFWLGTDSHDKRFREGNDVEAIKRGEVSVTPLSLDLTHRPTLEALRAQFK